MSTSASNPLRYQVLQLYKTLLYYGRDWPQGYTIFRDRCKNSFKRNANVQDPAEIQKLIDRGQFVIKEIEALYMLKKYRTLKRRYYPEGPQNQ